MDRPMKSDWKGSIASTLVFLAIPLLVSAYASWCIFCWNLV